MTLNLTRLNDSLDNQVNTLNVENQCLKLNLDNLKKIIEENEANKIKEKEIYNRNLNKLKEKHLLENESTLNEKNDQIISLEKDMTQYKNNLKNLYEDNLSLATNLEISLKSIEEYKSRNSYFETEIYELKKLIDDSNIRINNNEKEIAFKEKQNEMNISEYKSSIGG